MTAPVDIANVALTKIGATPITSFLDGSSSANAVAALYDAKRDELLRVHPWNFATKRAKLAQLSEVPALEFDHAYQLPDDWLRTVAVYDNDDAQGSPPPYKEEGRQILTSVDELWLRYIARIVDASAMTADFRETLACKLAAEMAVRLTNSNTLAELMQEHYERALRGARSTDSLGDRPDRRPHGSWMTRRGYWRSARDVLQGQ